MTSVNGETQRIGPGATVVDGDDTSAVCPVGVVADVASAKAVLAGEIAMVGAVGVEVEPDDVAWAWVVIAKQAISAPKIFAAVL